MSPRRRQRSSFGSVTKLDRDTWRLRWWADTPEGRRRVSETVHGTRRQAEDRLAEIRCEVGSEQGGSVTVGKAWELWYAPDCAQRLEEGSLAPGTWRNAEAHWSRNIAPRWAHVPCTQVRPLDVQEWLLTMSWSNARLSKIVLGQVMAMAAMYGACESNPLLLKYRLPKNTSGQAVVLTLDQLRCAWSAVHGSVIEAPYLLAAFGSARVGESLGVMASEVELREAFGVPVAVAQIVRQVEYDGTVVDRLKNQQSRRHVVLPGRVGLRLAELASTAVAEGLAWLADDGTGAPVSQRRVATLWAKALKSAGMERVPFKNLRNSWATFTHWQLGIDPLMVDKMMGHSTGSVLAKHYDRPDVDLFVETVAKAYAEHPYADTWDI